MINERWILTSRYVVAKISFNAKNQMHEGNIFVGPKITNEFKRNLRSAAGRPVVKSFCLPRDGDDDLIFSDLALLKLNEHIPIGQPWANVHPIQIARPRSQEWPIEITVGGWDVSFHNEDLYRPLRITEMKILEHSDDFACLHPDKIICAHHKESNPYMNQCFGDPGSPAVIKTGDTLELIGITSSASCG